MNVPAFNSSSTAEGGSRKAEEECVASSSVLVVESDDGTGVAASAAASGGVSGNAIVVSRRQTGNPILKYLRKVPYEFGETKADYDVGSGCYIVYLSLKFHRRHPDYITTRFKEIGHSFALQILLVLSDIEESEQRLRELSQLCLFGGWSVIVAHSVEEAAEYLESYKLFEHKPPDVLCGVDNYTQQAGTSISKSTNSTFTAKAPPVTRGHS